MKTTILSFFLILFLFTSCSKDRDLEQRVTERNELLANIEKAKNEFIVLNSIVPKNYFNEENPLEIGGYSTSKCLLKVYEKSNNQKGDFDNLLEEFLAALRECLPEDVLNPSQSNPDTLEAWVQSSFYEILKDNDFENFIAKSIKIENLVLETPYFLEPQKARLLTFTSVLRHIIGTMNYIDIYGNQKGVSSEWEDCFIEKLQDTFGCDRCYVEKLLCVTSWPTCLGAKALDCIIEVNAD